MFMVNELVLGAPWGRAEVGAIVGIAGFLTPLVAGWEGIDGFLGANSEPNVFDSKYRLIYRLVMQRRERTEGNAVWVWGPSRARCAGLPLRACWRLLGWSQESGHSQVLKFQPQTT